jgi:hydroxymethylbilane synthase
LARWQANWVADQLRGAGVEVELVLIRTTGDVTERSLQEAGGQGLFTKEIQLALLDGRIDLAVHSLKDLPTEPVPGLVLAAVPPRESPFDVLVGRGECHLDSLPTGARVGTGSRRRQSQLLHHRSDLTIADIRGNVDTRLRRLDAGDFDAIVLAEAGLKRLGLAARISQVLPHDILLPAIGQGALGLETRADDSTTRSVVARLDDPDAHAAVLAERALLAGLQGGCLAPVAAWGRIENGMLQLSAAVFSIDGRQHLSFAASSEPSLARQLGADAAEQLLHRGAGKLIAASRQA